MSDVKNEFVKPIVVLTVICLVISAALAFTNQKTASIIKAAEVQKADEAKKDVLPDGDSFTEVKAKSLPSTVTAVYKAKNDAGYVFALTAKGYGGDMTLMCGVDKSGAVTGCETLSHNETQGLGSKTALPDFSGRFTGKTSADIDSVETISGATISSKAYKNAIKDALSAFGSVKEAA